MVPLQFLVQLRQNYPQFAETSPQTGAYKQQDAEECWTQLLYTLNERLKVCTLASSQCVLSLMNFKIFMGNQTLNMGRLTTSTSYTA